jgi:hypothetical protein
MNGTIKTIRHIQIKQVAYCPNIFKAIITYEPYSTEYDESDDLEYQKHFINKLVEDKWFYNIYNKK